MEVKHTMEVRHAMEECNEQWKQSLKKLTFVGLKKLHSFT